MNNYDPYKHHHRSLRLRDWNYRSPGWYFVTICTHKKQPVFENQDSHDIATHALARIPQQKHAQHVLVDESQVMLEHAHVIFEFVAYPAQMDSLTNPEGLQNALAGSLGVIVGRYKTAVTTRINNLRQSKGSKVWQVGYYERIIRNERELQATREYIRSNPARLAEGRDDLDALFAKMTYHP